MTTKTFFKGICGMVAAVAFTACSGKDSIEGSWVEPIPGMENMVQGVCLEKGGKASSINMSTLIYEAWARQGDRLLLSGQSIGNHQTLVFTDTFDIEKLTDTELVLKRGSYVISYTRQAEEK